MDINLNKELKLDLIRIDGGTQQRDIDEDVKQRYMKLMQDGVQFPPVEVIFDGKDHWIWDGFHRYHCACARGDKVIVANVVKGTLREAIWLSFSANKAHGFPRQKGVAKDIIEQILTDKTWAKKSLSAIAKHVGVTQGYVSQVKDALSAHGISTNTIDEKKLDSDEENKASPVESTPDIERSEKIVVERAGTTYTQKTQEKKRRYIDQFDEEPKDNVGRVIPEHLQEVYERRSNINGDLKQLAGFRKAVMQRVKRREPIISLLNATAFQANYENLRRTLRSAIPYAVCPYCGGDAKDCKACKGFGFLNKDTYEAAPKELKHDSH